MVAVALLRAVNVVGRNRLPMDQLRSLCRTLGLRGVRTHIQSGNVAFAADPFDPADLARRIEDAIERDCGFRPDAILRTLDQLREVAARDLFVRDGADPASVQVTFFASDPRPDAVLPPLPERTALVGRELHAHYPDGIARSKLTPVLVERTFGARGTARNWNTVLKLVDLAGSVEE
jgi:uncharacterized protein (DUF1697 family)